jgi:hypothetical protein
MDGVPVAATAGDVAHYDVRRPTRACADLAGGGVELVCYAARRAAGEPRARASQVWVAHALGVERLEVTRALELCLPAAALD